MRSGLKVRGAQKRHFGVSKQAPILVKHPVEATRAGRRDHVGASVDLAAVASVIAEQVRLRDGLVHYRFGDNAELMGAWSSARNVLGPFRSRSEPAAGDGQAPSE